MSKNLVSTLPKLSWRGIVVPYSERSSGFSQESAEQKYVFKDEALIQSLGKKNTTLKFTIPFLEGIIYSSSQPFNQNGDIFSKTYFDFLAACKNREVGDLQDPVLGIIPAKVATVSDKMTPNNQDGLIMEVEFIHCPDPAVDATPPWARAGTAVQVGNLDAALGRTDWKQQEPPKPLLDPFNAMSSILDQSAVFVAQKFGAIDKMLFEIQKTNNSLDNIKDAKNADTRRLAENFKRTLIQTRDTAGSAGQVTKDFFTPRETTIGQLAQSLKLSETDLCRLNPNLVRNPKVPANTRVKYPVK